MAHKLFHCWLCAGLKVLIYSGDHDMCVPHTGSEAWTSSLGLKVKEAWRPWKVDHQVPTLPCIVCTQKRQKAKCRLSDHQVHATQVNSLQKGLFSASGEAIQCMLHVAHLHSGSSKLGIHGDFDSLLICRCSRSLDVPMPVTETV